MKNRCLRTGDKSHPVYGNPDEAPAITTLFNMWRHPSNPTYNSTHWPEVKYLPSKGYALVEEELASRELDEEILSKENKYLETISKVDENLNYQDDNNNESVRRRTKNTLNVDANNLPPSSQCGLAVSTVAYESE